MMTLNAKDLEYQDLNDRLHAMTEDCILTEVCGQRFIAAGLPGKKITVHGVPGNALGAYLDGAVIDVLGNAQDAVGDTMNHGEIVVHGNIGDAAGYAMRGGMILVRGDAGYRAGIHMKAYKEKNPLLMIGGTAGSFLGEYQAGGTIVVLGLNSRRASIVGAFPCTGMHGGKMFLRGTCSDIVFPDQVTARLATPEDMEECSSYVRTWCNRFNMDPEEILNSPFTVVTPDSKNPYRQMYVAN